MRTFSNRDLEASDRIERHIRRGGSAVLEGDWPRVLRLWNRLQGRSPDKEALNRLLVKADGDWVPAVNLPQHLPRLRQVAGREDGLVPLYVLLKGLSAMSVLHPVEAIGGSLVVHENVLVPRSQPLIQLLRRALAAVRSERSAPQTILDMGCGSGVCSVMAAHIFPAAAVTATDLLPEAAASASINAERFGLAHRISVAEPGDLFERLADCQYDLMIFNAPWVVAPVRTRQEIALNDRDQTTVQRFLREAGQRLTVRQRHADRIKTHRSNRPWQAIYAYDLARA